MIYNTIIFTYYKYYISLQLFSSLRFVVKTYTKKIELYLKTSKRRSTTTKSPKCIFPGELQEICEEYYERMYICEGQKWDLEYEVRKKDWEVLQQIQLKQKIKIQYIHILYIKKLKKKKKNKKIPKTDNATYKLFGIHTTFYFPLCCHVDTCF